MESSSPQELQSLQAPNITVEARLMKYKYPGMGSTSTGPESPVSPLMVGRCGERTKNVEGKYSK